MTVLRVRNADPARALVVRVWHRANACMSDGDAPWLDEDGVPTSDRSRDRCLAPGETLGLPVRDELALTLLPAGPGGTMAFAEAVRRYFRTGSSDSGGEGGAAVSLTNEAEAPLRLRAFASATFQFSPLREILLAPGETKTVSTSEAGLSLRAT